MGVHIEILKAGPQRITHYIVIAIEENCSPELCASLLCISELRSLDTKCR